MEISPIIYSSPENNTTRVIIPTVKYYLDAAWLLLLHHNTLKKGFFNQQNVYFNEEEYKYSILKLLSDDMKYEGVFEFLYEAPLLNQFLRWKQSENPLEIDEYSTYVKGLEIDPKSTMGLNPENGAYFGGLAKSGYRTTILDGTHLRQLWYYSVGMYSTDMPNTIEIPTCDWTYEAAFWVRIKDLRKNTRRTKLISKYFFLFVNFIE